MKRALNKDYDVDELIKNDLVRGLIRIAIDEDLSGGDITSSLCIPKEQRCTAEFLAKDDFVLCGIPIIEMLYKELNFDLKFTKLKNDGDLCTKGEVFLKLDGITQEILAYERTALNFLQRLSGIATKAKKDSALVPKIKIMDTRKTTPGHRVLEKYAIKVGGAINHRMGLSDMILVKNNHIDALDGDIRKVLRKIIDNKPAEMQWEVEVRNQTELAVALEFFPDIIMLDNMDNDEISQSLKVIRTKSPATVVEVSGGITEDRLSSLEELGVDCVSIGALTNRASSVDISLRITSFSRGIMK